MQCVVGWLADFNPFRATGSSIINVMICYGTEASAVPFTYNNLAGKSISISHPAWPYFGDRARR